MNARAFRALRYLFSAGTIFKFLHVGERVWAIVRLIAIAVNCYRHALGPNVL